MISLSLIVVGQWMPDDEPSWFESLAISKHNQICQIYGAPVLIGQELPKPLSSFISRPPAIQSRKFPAFLTAGPSTMTKKLFFGPNPFFCGQPQIKLL